MTFKLHHTIIKKTVTEFQLGLISLSLCSEETDPTLSNGMHKPWNFTLSIGTYSCYQRMLCLHLKISLVFNSEIPSVDVRCIKYLLSFYITFFLSKIKYVHSTTIQKLPVSNTAQEHSLDAIFQIRWIRLASN